MSTFVIVISCNMATFARSAPVLELKDTEHASRAAEHALSLTHKILEDIPETHKSCITHPDTFDLNSTENSNLAGMAGTIGIPSAPVLKALTQDFTMEMSLKRMSEGLQLHQALLNEVFPRLNRNERVDGLLADIRDLLTQIHTMVKPHVQPTLKLSLPGEYEVQVATHLALVQLRSFGCDMVRSLRSIIPENEEMDCCY